MKILVVANQKGGVGKTAMSLHLAWHMETVGLRVLVIDLDTQGNASYSLRDKTCLFGSGRLFGNMEDADLYMPSNVSLALSPATNDLANVQNMTLQNAVQSFTQNIDKLKAGGQFDVCIIDTPPSLGNTLAAALAAGDYVLCPIELETYSLQGIKQMAATIGNIRKVNSKLAFLGILPSKVDMRNPRHKRHLEEIKMQYNEIVIPHIIGLRSSIADALSSSLPVWKIKKTAARKAAQEMKAVSNYVLNKMQG
ncbi:TPA: ParA family protein [Neisseria gonorrhoeae]